MTLPEKRCARCGKSFAWRKKWARVWDTVRYCSQRCRSGKSNPSQQTTEPHPKSAR
ncbi:MAG: DUF2256 domain-containing protein [Planctomycetota bacterium]